MVHLLTIVTWVLSGVPASVSWSTSPVKKCCRPFWTHCRTMSSTRTPWQLLKSDWKLTFFTASCETLLLPSTSAFLIMALYKFLSASSSSSSPTASGREPVRPVKSRSYRHDGRTDSIITVVMNASAFAVYGGQRRVLSTAWDNFLTSALLAHLAF